MDMIMRAYPNGRLAKSIMPQRAIGRHNPGVTHEPSEAKQGADRTAIGPYAEPVLQIKPRVRVSPIARCARGALHPRPGCYDPFFVLTASPRGAERHRVREVVPARCATAPAGRPGFAR